MDFGVFSLMGYREADKSSSQVLQEAIEQTRLAEDLGFGMAWFAEHHFSNYCICPSPLMMVAHCAAVTKKIRLATGVIILPLYSPARLLSELAIVDALSEGRLVIGIGSGYQPYEFDRFGVDLATSKEMVREFADILDLAFTQDFFEYKGKYYTVPSTHISARFVNGFPQMWIGGDSEETYRLAARKGYAPIFSGRTEGVDGLVRTRKRCEEAFRAEGVDPSRMPIGMLRPVCVTHDKQAARQFAENVRYQLRLAGALRRREEIMEGTIIVDRPLAQDPDVDIILNTLPIGPPDVVAERLAGEIRALQPEHMSIYFQLGGVPQSVALKSMELLMGEVKPRIERALGPLSKIGIGFPAKRAPRVAAAVAAE